MYAVVIHLNEASTKKHYGDVKAARKEINNGLAEWGLLSRNDEGYYYSDKLNSVHCIIAVMNLAKRLPWLTKASDYMQLLRIEETSNLMPAIKFAESVLPEVT